MMKHMLWVVALLMVTGCQTVGGVQPPQGTPVQIAANAFENVCIKAGGDVERMKEAAKRQPGSVAGEETNGLYHYGVLLTRTRNAIIRFGTSPDEGAPKDLGPVCSIFLSTDTVTMDEFFAETGIQPLDIKNMDGDLSLGFIDYANSVVFVGKFKDPQSGLQTINVGPLSKRQFDAAIGSFDGDTSELDVIPWK